VPFIFVSLTRNIADNCTEAESDLRWADVFHPQDKIVSHEGSRLIKQLEPHTKEFEDFVTFLQ